MKFDIMKRIWLGLFLPKDTTTLVDYHIIHDLKMALSISEEERKSFNFRQEGQRLLWDPEAPDKEIEIGDRCHEIITAALKQAAKSGPINDENISLFNDFGIEGE